MKKRLSALAALLVAAAMLAALAACGVPGAPRDDSPGGPVGSAAPLSAVKSAGFPADLNDAVVLYIGSPGAMLRGAKARIDENPAVAPYIDNSRTMAPLRFVAEAMDFGVAWNERDRSVTLSKGGLILIFELDSNVMYQNGEKIVMDAKAVSRSGRTFVPVVYAARALGLQVSYDRGLVIFDETMVFDPVAHKALIDEAIAALSGLPLVGSEARLKELVGDFFKDYAVEDEYSIGARGNLALDDSFSPAGAMPAPEPAEAESAAPEPDGFSATNVQTEGVDEADIIKTDGRYIYHLTGGRIIISEVYPAAGMRVVSEISYDDFGPYQIYADGNRLCVLGSYAAQYPYDDPEVQYSPPLEGTRPLPDWGFYKPETGVKVYDVSDKASPALIRDFRMEGSAVDSRKIGDTLYLVVNYGFDYGLWTNGGLIIPEYSDGNARKPISPADMRYFPGSTEANLMSVCGIDAADAGKPPRIASFVGSGSQIYMSLDNLYVSKYSYAAESATEIYKFALADGLAIPAGSGSVAGSLLNQFSMDEREGYLRVAATIDAWPLESRNALYVLDPAMNVCSEIGDMAPGERIYSVRFMGDRAFLVTFRTVDPLFAVDLKNPFSPKVLGELKIPGYSSYLHPYDENLLIGFGRDTEELTTLDSKGNVVDVRAVNRGLKLALFDISDMSNPRERASVTIGDEYTQSELLYNHKALLFSKEKGIIAFPVTSYKYGSGETFAGAHVYNISPDGISLRGTISHDSGYYAYIQRILYIGDVLYTAANDGIMASDMQSLETRGSLRY